MLGIQERNARLMEATSRKLLEANVDFLLASFSDLNGSNRAKMVPSKLLQSLCANGAGFAGFAVGDLGQSPHDPDIMCIPDLGSMTILPWKRNFAWFAGALTVDGPEWPYCSRTILLKQLDRAKRMGYTMMTGVEPEFFLLKKDESGQFSPYDDKDVEMKPCYGQQALMRNSEFLGELIRYLNEDLGWGVYQADHEDANGQFEINWNYADALTTADRHSFFKFMVRTLAEQRGLFATFMPKPFSDLTGNGCHMHMSLWDAAGESNLFLDERDSRGLGLSETAYYFIGGLLHHAKACAAVFAPTVNSYKRLTAAATNSGATWTPGRISYGGNNRTQFIRVPAAGRMEYRAMDGSCNPYLAATVVLASGLDGIERRIDPGGPFDRGDASGRSVELLPANLSEAVAALERDDVILSALGEPFATTYIERKREDWTAYHARISPWELEKYLTV